MFYRPALELVSEWSGVNRMKLLKVMQQFPLDALEASAFLSVRSQAIMCRNKDGTPFSSDQYDQRALGAIKGTIRNWEEFDPEFIRKYQELIQESIELS